MPGMDPLDPDAHQRDDALNESRTHDRPAVRALRGELRGTEPGGCVVVEYCGQRIWYYDEDRTWCFGKGAYESLREAVGAVRDHISAVMYGGGR